MLELSISGAVGPGVHVFPRNGQLAGAIKDSIEYEDIIRDLVKDKNSGFSACNENRTTDFNNLIWRQALTK